MKKMCLLIIIFQLFSLPLSAQDYNALRKLGRGTSNITLGLTEIPRQMGIVHRDLGVVAGIFYGVPRGFIYALGRVALGLYETVTFLIPPYKPVIEPEFVFSEEYNDLTPNDKPLGK